MKGIYDGYRSLPGGEEAYFIGANTGRGFVNGAELPLAEGTSLEHLTILKGGAGTGKSTFMKKVAAEGKKRGCSVTVYRCGSDYESLDAVVIDGRIGVVDGTSPHVWEMKYPSVCSSIADMSKFLNHDALVPHKEEIMTLAGEKAERYRAAYRYLKAAEVLDGEIATVTEKAANREKIRTYAARLAKSLCGKEVRERIGNTTPTERSAYIGSVSAKGLVSLPTLSEKAETVVAVRDWYGFASFFLSELGKAFLSKGISTVYGKIPLNDRVMELYLPEIGVLFTAGETDRSVKTVNLKRFLSEEHVKREEGRLKLTVKCIHSLLEEATECLASAGEAHFGLERINTACMDFKGLNRTCSGLISTIFEKLTTS